MVHTVLNGLFIGHLASRSKNTLHRAALRTSVVLPLSSPVLKRKEKKICTPAAACFRWQCCTTGQHTVSESESWKDKEHLTSSVM